MAKFWELVRINSESSLKIISSPKTDSPSRPRSSSLSASSFSFRPRTNSSFSLLGRSKSSISDSSSDVVMEEEVEESDGVVKKLEKILLKKWNKNGGNGDRMEEVTRDTLGVMEYLVNILVNTSSSGGFNWENKDKAKDCAKSLLEIAGGNACENVNNKYLAEALEDAEEEVYQLKLSVEEKDIFIKNFAGEYNDFKRIVKERETQLKQEIVSLNKDIEKITLLNEGFTNLLKDKEENLLLEKNNVKNLKKENENLKYQNRILNSKVSKIGKMISSFKILE